ncbi:1-aminocyclopropane-1-carboxylate deaminase/D-cysteine desulfhydrase [Myroides pelagicus]|uniref:Pyridoxal-phosphate dependent enzyme n=1 Tax=Myroides pelagicus TaxID=270914 RepID=A0A7K1GQB8_9FLAO|nr:pyridoxal-phosphate dependent enzyme [Myroides pelagicus]MEC4113713.1 pyridoxal-phosphate dependent enzyme [Myroides pelagicus]MTH31051.1 pyridoxal-phosphate dependent enzyme [Myroides pelagicus]
MFKEENVFNQRLTLNLPLGIELYVKREDLLHREISGNKFRKLKYNISEAQQLGYKQLLTFGGAYSNHIAAVAAAGRILGIETIGVIRGDELVNCYRENPTLLKAEQDGMRFKFVSRSVYRERTNAEFIASLATEFGSFYLVPEGGTNALAIKGTEEILKNDDQVFDYVCCAIGTGGTIAGLINSSFDNQVVLGFPALKGDFLSTEIKKYTVKENWQLVHDYHFGGYGKVPAELVDFLQDLHMTTGVLFDPIYNGKMVYGVLDMIQQGVFKEGSRILLIHTGGLQGWNDIIKGK